MKSKIFFWLLFFSIAFRCNAQQFSFPLTISDSLGNTKSVILGYNTFATDSIDSLFGETNIFSSAYDTVLDVRASNIWRTPLFSGPWWGTDLAFQTAIQIVPFNCISGANDYSIIEIDIKTQNFPILVSWDSTLFFDSCRNGSLFTSNHPGGWWDVSDGERVIFVDQSHAKFNRSNYFSLSGNDTAWAYWVPIGNYSILYSEINNISREKNSVNIYPNPASNEITVSSNQSTIKTISITDILGKTISGFAFKKVSGSVATAAIKNLPAGIFFIKIYFSDGSLEVRKVVNN